MSRKASLESWIRCPALSLNHEILEDAYQTAVAAFALTQCENRLVSNHSDCGEFDLKLSDTIEVAVIVVEDCQITKPTSINDCSADCFGRI